MTQPPNPPSPDGSRPASRRPHLTVLRTTPRPYRFLWLKYLTGVDLTRHCARAFHGRYSQGISATPFRDMVTIDLNEFPAPHGWYLCGVTTDPSRWAENPHLALRPSTDPQHRETIKVQALTVILFGIEPVTGWGEHSIPDNDDRRRLAEYRTCRNWQYAHHLHAAGVSNIRAERPRGDTHRPSPGQLTFDETT
ncbi:hypothetical protein ABZ630_08175 [Streptomyces albidoflavus]|uniref:hypothetical protein n=1 Tax=Streptomyces albidoflavus TaxID=1886 RepID=UPI0033C7A2F6